MLIVMHAHATEADVAGVEEAIRRLNLSPHPMFGTTRTAIGVIGNTGGADPGAFSTLPGVKQVMRISTPYKLAGREMHPADTVIPLPQGTIGGGSFTVIAGPCAVETESMIQKTAEFLLEHNVRYLRAGAFKPRTSPHAFQGLGLEGLAILRRVKERTGVAVVTELMDTEHASAVEEVADIIQVGARNMQNYPLLRRLGKSGRPVLLKRGLAATLDELLMASEYILAGGNTRVALCERGVRTFADHSRNTLDLSVVPPAKKLSHLPILVDPSHGTGKRDFVPAMSYAALASGADGLLVEVHPDPDRAASDGAQSLDFAAFAAMMTKLNRIAAVLGEPAPKPSSS